MASPNRIALVIGNEVYKHAPKLANPRNDAMAVADALKRMGFSVDVHLDASHGTLTKALYDFGGKAENAEIALVYYAGHGIQVDGRNYLIPVESNLRINDVTCV